MYVKNLGLHLQGILRMLLKFFLQKNRVDERNMEI